ncbi:hypothetical protein [Flammeovirga sp. SJP92]|uniref:hypothetical protein n=1 Tax=Flammeovirga sp. SJP92 TaxID=1775430 RepID=UPI000787701D|nr:hypothetical protein [Flammeovirga sp. SJP92]KXX72625.1 hypothetical protein AVL50_06385 [Flammeovirga sp. SJP92]
MSKNKENPVYWKQVLVTIFTVYPLIVMVDMMLQYLFPMEEFHPKVNIFFTVVIVGALMVNPVMPLVYRYLGKWLYTSK